MFGAMCHKFDEVFGPQTQFIKWLIRHAVFILNRTVAQRSLDNKTRYEVLFGRKYNNNNIFEFL